MSYGIPCLATRVGGAEEIINSNCGVLVDPALNYDEIMEGLKTIKGNLPMRHQAFLNWQNNYNVEKNFDDLWAFIGVIQRKNSDQWNE